jgi:putative oxidoreductase
MSINRTNAMIHLRLLLRDRILTGSPILGWTALPLRLAIGYGFLAHGWAKLSRGPDSFGMVLQTLGVPLPNLAAWLTTAVELGGGAAVVAGVFLPLVGVPLAVVLLTALATIHYQYGYFSVKLAEVSSTGTKFGTVGYEIITIYLAGVVALALGGPGRLSLQPIADRLLARQLPDAALPAKS